MWHRTQFLVFTTMVSHSASLHTKRFPSNDIAVHKHRFMCYKLVIVIHQLDQSRRHREKWRGERILYEIRYDVERECPNNKNISFSSLATNFI
jgi:hypothetical protein